MILTTFIITAFLFTAQTEPALSQLKHLKVSENHRYLMQEDGRPFFWLGDTGWLLFSKLSREEAEEYLDDRAAKGFNVIQVMVIHDLHVTNFYGDSALVQGDISRPRITEGSTFGQPPGYDYWDHMDYIIDLAGQKGLYMALVPVWGSNVRSGRVSPEQAGRYTTWLARRYGWRPNVIWMNGGDTRGSENEEIWNLIGERIREHTHGQLITFHPFGRTSSSMWFIDSDWLDFNMFQSGHRRYDQDDTELAYGEDNWRYVRHDLQLKPLRPTIDGEPSYEGIPQGLHDPSQPYWDDDDVRRYAYWSVFAGACGFTYGHNAVMQMHKPGETDPSYGVREYWCEALDAPGASQMIHLKELMLSRPYFERIPDQSLIAAGQGERYDYLVATRGQDYALIYTCNGRDMEIRMGKINGDPVLAGWYDPRTGTYSEIGRFRNSGVVKFDPPGEKEKGNDWVLLITSVPEQGIDF